MHGQFYEYGQDAASIRWNNFLSENYKLIYPAGMDSLAMDFADKLEYFYPFQADKLNWKHKRIPVILHNESSFSNGVFVWAPARLEVFTNPNPNGYPQDWMTQLALHEGRHAFQVAKLEQGITKGLSYILGEQATGAVTGFLPIWYYEGDAVDAETRFSYTGRGRQPYFEMGIKAIVNERAEPYNFSKATLGSYKDYVPNHYELGYLLVRYGRRTYGDVFWQDFENFAAKKPFLIAPTTISMRKYGISSKRQFYDDAMDMYADYWNGKDNNSDRDKLVFRNDTMKKHYTSYRFPQFIANNDIIALKTGIDQIPEFVIIDQAGHEKRVFRPGRLNSGKFSYANNLIVWDEWVPDIRWSNRNYSVLKTYDIMNQEVKNLGTKTRYYAPDLSNSGKKIVAVEQQTDHTFYLVILDLEGNVILKEKAPRNQYIQHPAWMSSDSGVIVTLTNEKGEFLYAFNLKDKSWNQVYYFGHNDISWPVVHESKIFYSATATGKNNICYFDYKKEKSAQITNTLYGAFEPSISEDGDKLLFSDYHWKGYNAARIKISGNLQAPIIPVPDSLRQLDFEVTAEEAKIIEGSYNIKPGEYDPKPYRKIRNLVNIHSWLPLYFDYMNPESALNLENLPVSPGFTLLSQNLLSTAIGMLAYEYNDKMHYMHTGIRLKGMYPVFEVRASIGGLPVVNKIDSNDDPPLNPDRKLISIYSYIPLRLNTGKLITVVQPQYNYLYTSDLLPNENNTAYVSGTHRMHYRIYAGSYLRKGLKDILPRIGATGSVSYLHAPFDNNNLGSLSYAGLNIYLPGILKHQTIKLNLAKQIQRPEKYYLGNNISLPRGIKQLFGEEMNLYSADYVFPILYPDLNIEPFLYIKRIRASLWSDYLVGKEIMVTEPQVSFLDKNYLTYGADLLFDFHLLRLFFPISAGARISYVTESGNFIPEFLFSIDIN